MRRRENLRTLLFHLQLVFYVGSGCYNVVSSAFCMRTRVIATYDSASALRIIGNNINWVAPKTKVERNQKIAELTGLELLHPIVVALVSPAAAYSRFLCPVNRCVGLQV
jgi:hypothetical protein